MQYEEIGNRENPTLVCVPGILGGPENFAAMVPGLVDRYHIMIFDPSAERRDIGLTNSNLVHAMQQLAYYQTADEIAETLNSIGRSEAYFLGISLGGKIIYDFALKFPQMFAGGVVTDVGPGPFEETQLHAFIVDLVDNLDLTVPWTELRAEMNRIVPDRNLRIMLQSQIHYPEGKPPGHWKPSMRYLSEMLERQQMDNQFEGLEKVDDFLASEGRFIQVFKASSLSGIADNAIPRMKALKCIRLHPIEGTTHFLHVSHKNAIVEVTNTLPQYYPGAKERQKLASF